MLLKGRRVILSSVSSEDLLDKSVLASVLNTAKRKHDTNKSEIDYLVNYYKGVQPILYKTKDVRPEINNKIVMNHAQMATRDIVGYFLGSPIQYVQSGRNNNQDLVDELNRCVKYEDKPSVDKSIGDYQSITGTAYRIIYTDGSLVDKVPFEDRALDPATTFVVYSNDVSRKPLLGVTYYEICDANNAFVGTQYYVYTEFGSYDVMSKGYYEISYKDISDIKPYNVGGVPIIEYPNNEYRIGDWELNVGLMDTINRLHSGRMDDIDQIVQSLIVFVNADIDTTTYDNMRASGVLMLKNNTGKSTDVEMISNPLDQAGIGTYSQELEELLYALIGIPSRNNRNGGGGDTGEAVELRDGWANLEIIARNKELMFRRSEKQALKIILSSFNVGRVDKLDLYDIDIKFSRNKSNNLIVKTQGYMNLMSTKTMEPADCLSIVDLVSDENEYISRGTSFWDVEFAGKDAVIDE